MNDKEITKSANLHFAMKEKPITNLKEVLNLYDKEWLSDYYYIITRKVINKNKQTLINKIYAELTDENVIHRFLNVIKENEYRLLVRIIENNGILQDDYLKYNDYHYLQVFGIVYMFNNKNQLYSIIPDEIMDIIRKLNVNNYHKKVIENGKLVDLAYSMLNLHGVVPLDIYLDSCCKYYKYENHDEIDMNCVLMPVRANSIRIISSEVNIYMVKEEYLDDLDNSNKAIIHKIISRIEDDLFTFDFKDITLEDLLKYNDMDYYEETNAVLEFKEYLKKINIDDENINSLIGVVIQFFRKDYNEAILFINELFEEENISLTKDNIDEILTYINNIINNIPIWGNKGWTNREIILGNCFE